MGLKRAIFTSALVLGSWPMALQVAIAQVAPVCSSENSCTCPTGSGQLQCGSGSGGGCPAGQTQFCTASPNAACPGRSDLTCFQTGNPPGTGSCNYVIQLQLGQADIGLTGYIGSGLPGCLHGNAGGCLWLAGNTNPPQCAGYFATEAPNVARTHCLRDCLLGSFPNNVGNPPSGSGVPNWPSYGFNTGLPSAVYSGAAYPNLIFDQNCNFQGFAINYNAVGNACGGITLHGAASPISLVMEDGYDVESDVAIVSFPIDNGAEYKLYTWKASDKAPLLVYDPEQKGQITSATQLFGNWTFGGKQLASLVTSGVSTEWRDGYEALATLDRNRDGKVSGEELKNLALWFDSNRNGISESGEVQPLAKHDVSELYYAVDRRDELTRSVHASKGFMREVNGEKVIGASVDWYSASADTLDAFMNNAEQMSKRALGSVKSDVSASESSAAKNSAVDISGRWRWSATSAADFPSERKPQGVFYIQEDGKGGFLMASMNYSKGDLKSKNVIGMKFAAMSGTKSITDKGSTIIQFETPADSGGAGALLKSSAVLRADGSMDGETTASGSFIVGKTGTIRYQWIATREE